MRVNETLTYLRSRVEHQGPFLPWWRSLSVAERARLWSCAEGAVGAAHPAVRAWHVEERRVAHVDG